MDIKPVAFTLTFDGKSNVLATPISIYDVYNRNPHFKPFKETYTGLWDTGSITSIISNELASKLNLTPVGETIMDTAGGKIKSNNYIICIQLPNHLNIEEIVVSSGNLGNGIDLLLGMDIITLGDFSITNVNNRTVFSFRFPSIKKIDYVKE